MNLINDYFNNLTFKKQSHAVFPDMARYKILI